MQATTYGSEWSEMKSSLKSKFSKLTDEHIESLKGNLNKLSEKLQSVYHYSKEKADKESETFESNCSKEAGTDHASKTHAKQNEKTQDSTHLASHSNSPPMKKTSEVEAQHSSVTHSKETTPPSKNESMPKKGFPIKTIKKAS